MAERILDDSSDTIRQPDTHIAPIAGRGRFGAR